MFEPIGLVTILMGGVCMLLGYRATTAAFVAMTVLGSAAAMFVGAANIQPAHLFLGFVAVAVFSRRQEATAAFRALHPPEPGFWFACLVIYGVATAFLLPRMFAGTTLIIPLGASEYAGDVVPLGPVSSNLTQSIYLIADLTCFALIVAVASTRAGFEAVTNALILYAVLNVLFALLDLGTSLTGTQELLQFMRNTRYTLHHEEEVNGMKRIVGSWPEASAFAGTTLGIAGFIGTMWLCQLRPGWTGPLALTSVILIILSTSSTGLAGIGPLLIVLYATALKRCGIGASSRNSAAVVLLAPPFVMLVGIVILLDADTSATIANYIDTLILSKSTTQSAQTRGAWNTFALQNFFDSWGFGIGLGTNRTSSFPLALLSNVGVPGTIFYVVFVLLALRQRRGVARTFPSDVRMAARVGCVGLLVGSVVAGPTVDQGLLFSILAGLSSAQPESDRRRQGACDFN